MRGTWILFRSEGRINRAPYWLAGITSVFAPLIFMSLLLFAVGGLPPGSKISFGIADLLRDPLSFGFGDSFRGAGPTASVLLYLIAAPVCAATVWFFTASSIRRLHDRNRSGWWFIPFIIGPLVLPTIGDRLGDSALSAVPGMIVSVAGFWGFVEMACLGGTRGPNRFGADPLALPDTRPGWDQQSELEMIPHSAGPSPATHGNRGHE
jgi:uncharacterized membrane protein YhaH (DUF805 family)